MEKLFTPHFGLMVWTIVTFLLLAFILGRYGWKPLLKGLDDREKFLREQREAAEQARAAAENSKRQHDQQLADVKNEVQAMLTKANEEAQMNKEKVLLAARDQAEKMVEKGRKDLALEADKLKAELKTEVADLAVMVAEKVLSHSMDPKLKEQVHKDSLKEISGVHS